MKSIKETSVICNRGSGYDMNIALKRIYRHSAPIVYVYRMLSAIYDRLSSRQYPNFQSITVKSADTAILDYSDTTISAAIKITSRAYPVIKIVASDND